MTIWIGQLLAFAVGVWISIRAIAALYGVLDLWCTIRTAWPRVASRILGWGAAITALLLWLGEPYRGALAAGLGAFLAFYLGLYAVRNAALAVLRRRSAPKDKRVVCSGT